MIGELPTSLEIGGENYPIRSDFRVMLRIYEAFNDPDLTDREKLYICLNNLFEDFASIPKEYIQEASEKAYWFAGGGGTVSESSRQNTKILDWEQDEKLIFPAINKVAGYETRSVPYLHWWTFLGMFGEVGEGMLSQVLHIRQKKAKGKKLDKWEEEFIRDNRELIEIRRKYSKEEKAERDRINAMLD